LSLKGGGGSGNYTIAVNVSLNKFVIMRGKRTALKDCAARTADIETQSIIVGKRKRNDKDKKENAKEKKRKKYASYNNMGI
jgi:hypothetical protein